MARDGFWRIFRPITRLLHSDSAETSLTTPMAAIDERTVRNILDLAMRVGDLMTAVGASAHEATLAVNRITSAYGLREVHVNLTYNSLTVSYIHGIDEIPMTLMRVIRASVPDYSKLQKLQALVVDIETGLELDAARAEARRIRKTPFMYRVSVVLLSRAALASGVSVVFGASTRIVILSFFAALAASLVQFGLAKTRVPLFFSQIAGGFAVTAVAVAVSALAQSGVELFQGINPTIIVASGIMLMLAGLSVVGSVQDAIDGFALTATGRILDLCLQTLGVVLGILAGLEVGRALGFTVGAPADAPLFGSLPEQLIGALVVSIAVAMTNGAGLRAIIVSGLLSIVTMFGYNAIVLFDLHIAVAAGVGALAASFIGTLIAHRLHVPSMAVTTAAIIPLVPGMAVFRGLLGLVQFDETGALLEGVGALASAVVTGIALATGASLGLSLATPLRATLSSVMRARSGARAYGKGAPPK